MQKNIAYQQDSNETVQQEKDKTLSNLILERKSKNAKALASNYPELYRSFLSSTFQKYSLFINRSDEINIFDSTDASTIYGPNVKQQQVTHAEYFVENKQQFLVQKTEDSFQKSSSVLVVFGSGLGHWILPILKHSSFKHIVIFEPEEEIIYNSFLTADWNSILNHCENHQVSLYLQVGEECHNLKNDINQLLSLTGEKSFYLYRHLNYSLLDDFYTQLIPQKTSFDELRPASLYSSSNSDQVPLFSLWKEQLVGKNEPIDKKKFKKNLQTLKARYQNLFEEISEYSPTNWELVKTKSGEFNLYHTERHVFWYNESAEKDEGAYVEYFQKNPGGIKPVFGSSGGIIKDYIHFQYVHKFVALRNELGFKRSVLPYEIPALSVFCPALGVGVESLLLRHKAQTLFWFEPNIDFFYWSLHVIDWSLITEQFEANESFLFLHIGGDGESIVNDLMGRINSTTGNYAINTYYYTPYLSLSVRRAVSRVVEDIASALSLIENYEHSLFAITHFRENLKNGVRILTSDKRDNCLSAGLNVPLFIVGNGPSLDKDIETIKSVREKVLLMSCGTALKALWANGIQPDFHAEVEQHKNSYNILKRLNDPDYLKGITFIGGSWVYPRTPDLFKLALTALKDGEGTTLAIRKLVPAYDFLTIKRSFPTVANLALGFAKEMRFKEIYFFGLDLGFIDVRKHHSKHSIFFNNSSGGELYKVEDQNWGLSVVKGNFRPVVQTKFDFKLSLRMLEKTIVEMDAEIYNCSDGAKIDGTMPLNSDMLLVSSTPDMANSARKVIEECVYEDGNQATILDKIDSNLDVDSIVNDINVLINILDKDFESEKSVNEAFLYQKQLLVDKYHSGDCFFYSLMISTVTYLQSILTHFLYYGEDWSERKVEFGKANKIAISMLEQCRDDFSSNPTRIDDTDWDALEKI